MVCYFQVSQFSKFAKPAVDWLEKKVAHGKLRQNPRDKFQSIEFYQSSAKALEKLWKSSALSSTKALQTLY